MTYRELQKALAIHKQNCLTNIALNSQKAVLEAELDRIQALLSPSLEEIEDNRSDIDDSKAVENFFTEAKQTISELKIKYSDQETKAKNLVLSSDNAEVSEISESNVFPTVPKQGLIHKIIHLVICTYVLFMYYFELHIPERKSVWKLSTSTTRKVSTQGSIFNESIFPTTPKTNLIARIIHLGICTCIFINSLLFPKVRVPVIHMAGSYQVKTS